MSKKKLSFLLALTSSLFLTASTSYAFGDFGADVNAACAPAQPFTGSCTLCHTGGYSASTPAKTAFLSGGSALTNYFCPSGPTCTDSDNDSFALEGGACGPVDCNDNNAAVNPGAAEVCGDGIDNTCNGVVDEGCPTAPVCTDNDGDTFALEGGECGVVDCDDTDAAVHPSAVEDCTDGIDNNCNGLVDAQDGGAVNCPAVCTDGDGDSYAVEGGECGPVDCNDADATVNPGAAEICADGVDNDCDTQVDEGCDPACPDADGDGFTDAACGGNDCNDLSAAINPGASEVCGNGVDENCNGSSDDTCLTCPEGGVLSITDARYKERELDVKGRSHLRTRISIVDADSGQVLAENIRVDGGKWKAEIEKLARGYVPETIKAINTEGCETEKDVTVKGRPQREDDDDRDDD